MVVRAYLAGLTAQQIGRAFGFTKQRAHELLTDALGCAGHSTAKRGQHHLIPQVLADLKAYYDRKATWKT
jgi:hypothetical protein